MSWLTASTSCLRPPRRGSARSSPGSSTRASARRPGGSRGRSSSSRRRASSARWRTTGCCTTRASSPSSGRRRAPRGAAADPARFSMARSYARASPARGGGLGSAARLVRPLRLGGARALGPEKPAAGQVLRRGRRPDAARGARVRPRPRRMRAVCERRHRPAPRPGGAVEAAPSRGLPGGLRAGQRVVPVACDGLQGFPSRAASPRAVRAAAAPGRRREAAGAAAALRLRRVAAAPAGPKFHPPSWQPPRYPGARTHTSLVHPEKKPCVMPSPALPLGAASRAAAAACAARLAARAVRRALCRAGASTRARAAALSSPTRAARARAARWGSVGGAQPLGGAKVQPAARRQARGRPVPRRAAVWP